MLGLAVAGLTTMVGSSADVSSGKTMDGSSESGSLGLPMVESSDGLGELMGPSVEGIMVGSPGTIVDTA